MVPSQVTVSGMTLKAVPASMRVTVTTAGSKAGRTRVTIACKAVTISQATGTGSVASWGIEACPPRPMTVIWNSSEDAIIVPPRQATRPGRNDRRGVDGKGPVDGPVVVEQALVQHHPGPAAALLAGLEHQHHPTRQITATGDQQPGRSHQHGDVGIVATGVHLAVLGRSELQPGVLGHLEGVHVGAQQGGGSGPVPFEGGHDGRGGGAGGDLQAEAVEGLEDGLLGDRQIQAGLRVAVDAAAQLDGLIDKGSRFGQQGGINGRWRYRLVCAGHRLRLLWLGGCLTGQQAA